MGVSVGQAKIAREQKSSNGELASGDVDWLREAQA